MRGSFTPGIFYVAEILQQLRTIDIDWYWILPSSKKQTGYDAYDYCDPYDPYVRRAVSRLQVNLRHVHQSPWWESILCGPKKQHNFYLVITSEREREPYENSQADSWFINILIR